jgi:hypothetical protein
MNKATDLQVLCIPRVNSDISEAHIRKTLEDLNLGKIERIDIVSRNNEKNEKYNRVFVHLRWNNLENANISREILLAGKEIKVFYTDKWFWKISAYREPENRRKNKTQQ